MRSTHFTQCLCAISITVSLCFAGLEAGHQLGVSQGYIAEAKSHFSELVKLALQGEEIVIARNSKPLLTLTPLSEVKKKRLPGSAKGLILAVSPDFDDLPDELKEYV